MLATDFLTSNYIKAEDIRPNFCIEATIVSVRPHDFEDGSEKLVVYVDTGQGVVLNQTRLKALIAAHGPHPDNWLNKLIVIRRGTTVYVGREVPCVVIEPVVAERIGAEQRPVIGRPALKSVETQPGPDRAPDGPDDPDGEVPF